jgi:hemolysin III
MRQEFGASAMDDRPQARGEEIANSLSHGVGLIAALAGSPFLIRAAVERGDALVVAGVSVFAASMVLVYLSSMMYHSLPEGRGKRVFLIIDHIAIFLLIAGTYTPFALGVLRGVVGWSLFVLIWGLALVGIMTKLSPALRHSRLSLVLYLGMGWSIMLVIRPLYQHLPLDGLLWVIGGGLAYTVGVIFFVANRKYSHFIWHLFTITGTTCHYFAILWYAF